MFAASGQRPAAVALGKDPDLEHHEQGPRE
jgi:hypothetical protein